MNAVQKLRQMVSDIRRGPAVVDVRASWELVGRLIGRMPVDMTEAARVCAARDVDALDAMVARLENPQSAHQGTEVRDTAGKEAAPGVEAEAVSKDDMDKALRAFRKRLKVMRLSEESKLGGRQLTGGRKSEIDAILPPHEFPSDVWQALERAGRLKAVGQGFYAMP